MTDTGKQYLVADRGHCDSPSRSEAAALQAFPAFDQPYRGHVDIAIDAVSGGAYILDYAFKQKDTETVLTASVVLADHVYAFLCDSPAIKAINDKPGLYRFYVEYTWLESSVYEDVFTMDVHGEPNRAEFPERLAPYDD